MLRLALLSFIVYYSSDLVNSAGIREVARGNPRFPGMEDSVNSSLAGRFTTISDSNNIQAIQKCNILAFHQMEVESLQ